MDKDQLIAEQAELIKKLEAKIILLEARIVELESRLSKTSKNSHKPSSQDIYAKNQSLRRPSDKSTGAQKDHKGNGIKRQAVDEIQEIPALEACACGQLLSEVEGREHHYQIADIPPIKAKVTEYRCTVKTCPKCKQTIKPSQEKNTYTYGENIKSLIIYLSLRHFIPGKRLAELSSAIFKTDISEGVIHKWLGEYNHKIQPILSVIERYLKVIAYVKHIDETGVRVNGTGKHWAHVLSNQFATLCRVDRRGKADILQNLCNFIVSDCFPKYISPKNQNLKVLCNQHIMRELQGLIDQKHEPCAFAQSILNKLKELLILSKQPKTSETLIQSNAFKAQYLELINQGLQYYASLPRDPNTKSRAKRRAHNLYLRLIKNQEAFLRFLDDPNIPFTNNQAEQDLRMVKVKQKISGCFRSIEGSQIFANIYAFLSTARKLGIDALYAIQHPYSVATRLLQVAGCE